MSKNKVVSDVNPEDLLSESLSDVLRTGAQRLLATAIEAEVDAFIDEYRHVTDTQGRRQIIRNGYHPTREISTGVGPVTVKKPKVRDLSGHGITWQSSLLPAYLKSVKESRELLPWLYLKGVSTGEMDNALRGLLGESASLSAGTVSRLKATWVHELQAWQQRDLSLSDYVYWWVDGIYSGVRGDENKVCSYVVIGVKANGIKELIALEEGYRESELGWLDLLRSLRNRGLAPAKLAVADGHLGFWKALPKVYPETRGQRCWVHKTANVLDKLPKAQQPGMKAALHDIYLAADKSTALDAWKQCVNRYEDKYPNAIKCLAKDKAAMLTFYDFPAAHWQSIRTTNPIESTFATVRQRSRQTKNCGTRNAVLSMIFKLIQQAQHNWNRLPKIQQLQEVLDNVVFINGVKEGEKKAQDGQKTEAA